MLVANVSAELLERETQRQEELENERPGLVMSRYIVNSQFILSLADMLPRLRIQMYLMRAEDDQPIAFVQRLFRARFGADTSYKKVAIYACCARSVSPSLPLKAVVQHRQIKSTQ